jgi:hypothetical protein
MANGPERKEAPMKRIRFEGPFKTLIFFVKFLVGSSSGNIDIIVYI